MNNILTYILESGTCLLVFYLIYQVLLKKETFYRLNRAFLLFAVSFSLVIPLLKISIASPGNISLIPVMLEPVTVSVGTDAVGGSSGPGLLAVIMGLYLLVIGVLAGRLMFNVHRIQKLYNLGSIKDEQGCRIVIHEKNHPPFSFFRTIFISNEHLKDDSLEDIIEHEKAHIRQLHSVDILITEMMIILQWVNPLAWLYKKLIRENHEFLADEAVLNRGFSPDAYQVRIISQLFGIRSMPAAHNFNNSIIQKRLKMIKKPKSPSLARIKFLLVVPAALAMFYMFACSTGDSQMLAQEAPESESPVYLTPDEPAEYLGGTMALRKYIAQNVLYPEEAKKKGVQGRIYVQFIVDEKGKMVQIVQSSEVPSPPPPPPPPATTADIEGIVVVGYRPPKGTDLEFTKEEIQLLADEAIRVLKNVPGKWKPAMKDGKPVKTAWTMPIQFLLQ